MTDQDMIVDGAGIALAVLDFVFPAAGPIISIARAAIPAVIAAGPYIKAAVVNGESAIAAAEKASPGLKGQLVGLLNGLGAPTSDLHLENLVRVASKLPQVEQEPRWMTDAKTGA